MPVFLAPLHEFNPCHTPSGPRGGQFCATGGAEAGYPPAAQAALAKLRPTLMRESFGGGQRREVLAATTLTGTPVGAPLPGEIDAVDVPEALWQDWIAKGPVVTAHTHPGDATISLDDVRFHNDVNVVGQASHPHRLAVAGIHVYGEGGSWYSLQFSRVLSDDEMTRLSERFTTARDAAQAAAERAEVAWAKQQPWWTARPPKTWDLMTEAEHIRHAAEKAGALDALDAHFNRQFRNAAQDLWGPLAREFGLTYRYQLAD